MSNEPNQVLPEDPTEAEPGRGAPGDNHYGVQTAQTTAVNAPDAIIPSNAPTELSEHQVEALEQEEEKEFEGITTTDGYVIDEAGLLNNFAVEPPMYIEGEEPKV
ncbi:hypothetical protein [Synechocystis sp. PCC 7509]|uniref:hypothetical protein n=1 Tax=Synechocystis sp. PCC 7509 TaxID=927677 RepID=UPI0002AD187A|nr:hypothetical protein [Synechocystis sp. PCC 7509]